MNGAQALIRTLVDAGVDVCFTNPGTSEMHFVAALDSVPEMRATLGLFEGVVTGAADGYGRMAGKPAATLLHLGPGLGNGLANLHNARRARTPLVNIVGDHATYHQQYDAPLQSEIDSVARAVSGWMRSSVRTGDVARDAADAVAAATSPPGHVATLILPADVSWGEGAEPAKPIPPTPPRSSPTTWWTQSPRCSCPVSRARCWSEAARRVNAAWLPRAASPTRRAPSSSERRSRRGWNAARDARRWSVWDTWPSSRPRSSRAYVTSCSSTRRSRCRSSPIRRSRATSCPTAVTCTCSLPAPTTRSARSSTWPTSSAAPMPTIQPAQRPERPSGELTGEAVANTVGALLPEGAIVSDEANTAGLWVAAATAGAPPHDSLTLTGGAIGQGLPVATGAAVACPDRKVVCLEADGSAMYTLQALWTQAREGLDVTTVIFNNRSYAILNLELSRVGAESPGPKALDMLDLSRPDLDFAALAKGMGVPAARATTADELVTALERGLVEPGPFLVDAVLPPRL